MTTSGFRCTRQVTLAAVVITIKRPRPIGIQRLPITPGKLL